MIGPGQALTLGQALWALSRLSRHDRWSREQLLAFQARRLAELRSFAVAHSPYYREAHRGLEDAPLEALPSLSKTTLMERFDDLVTDRAVHLTDVEAYLRHATVTGRYRGRYRVQVTGGTTGYRGIFLVDPAEWTAILASYGRARVWAGVGFGPSRPPRLAFVSSRNPTHQTSLVGATTSSPIMPTLRLDATDPTPAMVAALNQFRPDMVSGYASVLRLLADEQLAGRLEIRPRAVANGGEVLDDETRARIRMAFGVRPRDGYAATETGVIAYECAEGHLHRFEDLVVAEVVDAGNRPVPDGEQGAKVLVTVLSSRTQPLIRYELSDRVTASAGPMPGDLPFGTLGRIQGRQEDVLYLAGVPVHPKLFADALERLPVAGWQVVDEGEALRVLLAGTDAVDTAAVSAAIGASLRAIGVEGVQVSVEVVPAIPRTAAGKAPLVRRAGRSPAGAVPTP
ncbi:MAG TPA: hypothetical protein VFW02_02260 [Candidatus Limnocylindrales bacterium]|nr:hypothetical protein [Candidatus Limnocylindrales bacterium]